MGLLLLGEKRTQDTHSEWLSSCKGWKESKILSTLDHQPFPQLQEIYFDSLVFTPPEPKPSIKIDRIALDPQRGLKSPHKAKRMGENVQHVFPACALTLPGQCICTHPEYSIA